MNKTYLMTVLVGLLLFSISIFEFRQPLGRVLGFRELLKVVPVEPETIEVVAVGDVMLGRSVNSGMVSRNNWMFPFEKTAQRLSQADITFGNLESPFGQNCPVVNDGMVFCADKRSIAGLVSSGFDVMSLANNHSHNQGLEGLSLSNDWLEENGIRGLKELETEVLEKNGIKTSWIAIDAVDGRVDQDALSEQIVLAKKMTELVLVSVHWGWEYNSEPNSYQQELAHHIIDSGADLIIGHHPHWRQTVEEYKGKTIFYSLGNFVFDQMWSEETRLGNVAFITLDKNGLVDYSLETVKIFEYAQPRWVE